MKEPARYPYYDQTSLSRNNSPDGTWVVLMGPSQAWDCMQLRLSENEQLHLVVHVHASFSKKFIYLVVEGVIPKYLGW